MTAATFYSHLNSPLGDLLVYSDGRFITGLFTKQHKRRGNLDDSSKLSDAPFETLREQLAEYFAGKRQTFDVPIKLVGTPFQRRVWQELTRIPFGTTITYGELARRIGRPTASRAVGHANGRNPVSILVPCHRVIGSNGSLTGYGGGLANKQRLLELELGALAGELERPLRSRPSRPVLVK